MLLLVIMRYLSLYFDVMSIICLIIRAYSMVHDYVDIIYSCQYFFLNDPCKAEFYIIFFFNDTATTEIYTRSLVGSVRCV